jgi:hypothetical protein
MKFAREFVANVVVGGLLILLPIYFAILVLLKGMQSVAALVKPLAVLLPDWLPAENLLSLLLILVLCFLVGIAVRTRLGARGSAPGVRESHGRGPAHRAPGAPVRGGRHGRERRPDGGIQPRQYRRRGAGLGKRAELVHAPGDQRRGIR